MNLARDVLAELRAMFVADARMTLGIAVLIALVTALVTIVGVEPLVAGFVLLAGCIATLIEAVFHAARGEVSR